MNSCRLMNGLGTWVLIADKRLQKQDARLFRTRYCQTMWGFYHMVSADVGLAVLGAWRLSDSASLFLMEAMVTSGTQTWHVGCSVFYPLDIPWYPPRDRELAKIRTGDSPLQCLLTW